MSQPMSQPESAASTLNPRQLQIASLIVATSFVISGALGLLRQAIIGSAFGAGEALDAFYAAYRIPEMLFTLIAGGALGSAFIPVFSRFLTENDQAGAWRLASAVMSLVGIIAALIAIAAFFLSDWLTRAILIPAASPDQQALTASLMRVMLATVVIFSISGLIMGLLNANQRFLAPALAPSMNNIGLILGALLIAPWLGVYGLAWGAVLGAALHLIVQIPALRVLKPDLRFLPDVRIPGAAEVLRLMGPRVIGAGVVQINFVVNTALASAMAAGSVTALSVAFILMFVVLGVVGQSVGTAIFPTLSLLNARNDKEGFRNTLSGALRGVLFTSIPAMIGLILMADPLINTIYLRGRWTNADTLAASWALIFFSFGLPAFALQEILARAFFALKDTITPVLIAVLGVALNIVLSLILIRVVIGPVVAFGEASNPLYVAGAGLWPPEAGQGPFGGLALANALATMIESVFLWLLLRRRVGGLNDRAVLTMALRTLIAALAMGAIVFVLGRITDGLPALIQLVIGAAVGVIVFEGVALLIGLSEARRIPMAMLRRFKR